MALLGRRGATRHQDALYVPVSRKFPLPEMNPCMIDLEKVSIFGREEVRKQLLGLAHMCQSCLWRFSSCAVQSAGPVVKTFSICVARCRVRAQPPCCLQ